MRKTFAQMVADGEARQGTGPPPEQRRFSARELRDDMVSDEPQISCANCGAYHWAVNAGSMECQCLGCGALVALWPEIPLDEPEDD